VHRFFKLPCNYLDHLSTNEVGHIAVENHPNLDCYPTENGFSWVAIGRYNFYGFLFVI
jgi:hypothetical protein